MTDKSPVIKTLSSINVSPYTINVLFTVVVGNVTAPVNVGDSLSAFEPNDDAIDEANSASELENALDNCWIASKAEGNVLIKLTISVLTNSVVAICVFNVPIGGVGANGEPVNCGDSNFANPERFTNSVVATFVELSVGACVTAVISPLNVVKPFTVKLPLNVLSFPTYKFWEVFKSPVKSAPDNWA